jgi:hypothetical protein
MTTRFSGFQVTLADEVREDDAEHIINAIRMLKGVRDVRPFEAATFSPEVTRCRIEMAEKVMALGRELLK